MTNEEEVLQALEDTIESTENSNKDYREVLVSKGEVDVTLSDGTLTPNLNKRVRTVVGQVPMITDGNVTMLDGTSLRERDQWVAKSGAALPYNPSVDYNDKAVVVKDGVLSQMVDGQWVATGGQKLQKAATVNSGLGYSKRLIANIPFKYPGYDKYSQIFKQYNCFPQGFTFDPKNNHIYISINSNLINTFAVWDVSDPSNLKLLTIFKIEDSTFGNEGLIVKHDKSKRYMYFRSDQNRIRRLDITTLPSPGSVIPLSQSVDTGMPAGANYGYYNGYFIAATTTPAAGSGTLSRGIYNIYDSKYELVSSIKMDGASAGTGYSAPYTKIFPKIQGFGMTPGGYVGSSGGGPDDDVDSTYTNVGTLVWDDSGNLASSNLITRHGIEDYVRDVLGETPQYCESEGLYTDETGRVYTLVLYVRGKNDVGAERGGILIFEEFSTHLDAIDFSSYAAKPPLSIAQKGVLQPITYFKERSTKKYVRGMLNPFTGDAMRSWYEICGYMTSMELDEFRYYSNAPSDVSPTDMLGNTVPASTGLITIKACNTNTFIVTCENNVEGVRRYELTYSQKTQKQASNRMTMDVLIRKNAPTLQFDHQIEDGTLPIRGSLGISASGRFGLYDSRNNGLWIFYRDDSGDLFLGTNTQVHGVLTTNRLNVKQLRVFADNASAKAGGLIDGDVYRTSTGQLMIVY